MALLHGNDGDQVVEPDFAALMASPKTADRLRAVDALAGIGGADALTRIADCLRADRNENLRMHCAELLGAMGPAALPALAGVLGTAETPRAVRCSAARALAKLGAPAIPALAQAAAHDRDDNVRQAAVVALVDCGGPAATAALLTSLTEAKPSWLKARIVHALGDLGDRAALPAIQPLARHQSADVAKAAIGATARLDRSALISMSSDLLTPATDVKARRRLVAELSAAGSADVIPALARAVVSDPDEQVGAVAADGLARLADMPAKLSALLTEISTRHRGRSDLPCALIVRAARHPADDSGADGLTAQLLTLATQAKPPLTGILADILVANAGGDPDIAGQAIDAYQAGQHLDPVVLQPFRIEVGGAVTLDPVLQAIREDLRQNFQQPIQALNQQTTDMWQNTIAAARRAFVIRTVMSICVFVLGVALIGASIALFATGKLSTAQAVGSGTAFTGGLAATLLTVYSGPLKDIRQSISDLGAANVAFIGFVHQVLQVSHTFSAHYLRGTVSFDEAQQASAIIASASATATAALAATGSSAASRRHG